MKLLLWGLLGLGLVSPAPPVTADAFAFLKGQSAAAVGVPFTLDLRINAGTQAVVGAQSYLLFPPDLLEVVDPTQPGCVPATTVQPDLTRFEFGLQNVVDNAAGQLAYAAGTLGPGVPGEFRVARVTFCARAGGTAVLHWQFSPPAPLNRNSRIIAAGSVIVSDPARYTDVPLALLTLGGGP